MRSVGKSTKKRIDKYKCQNIQRCKDNSGEEDDSDDDDYSDNNSSTS